MTTDQRLRQNLTPKTIARYRYQPEKQDTTTSLAFIVVVVVFIVVVVVVVVVGLLCLPPQLIYCFLYLSSGGISVDV